ncbi:hypothetical protein AVEN_212337-1 [Araneus ventricosus]|uniref:Uncharacterized protein n=1 Tax=Araneus ventricosus TaxID=182803 RepID=A0A4Y2F3H8_ARAVE|nr:hypothetical protein AVEN_212337-1 [Araneus ventricosus]
MAHIMLKAPEEEERWPHHAKHRKEEMTNGHIMLKAPEGGEGQWPHRTERKHRKERGQCTCMLKAPEGGGGDLWKQFRTRPWFADSTLQGLF